MPESLINIIEYFYNSSYVRVKFNSVAGNFFFWKLGDGARQGGVLSAYLFNFYIDEAIRCVADMEYGCILGSYPANVFCYADDIVLPPK